MKFLDAVGHIAISKSVWSQLLDENEKGRSVTLFQDVSLDGTRVNLLRSRRSVKQLLCVSKSMFMPMVLLNTVVY